MRRPFGFSLAIGDGSTAFSRRGSTRRRSHPEQVDVTAHREHRCSTVGVVRHGVDGPIRRAGVRNHAADLTPAAPWGVRLGQNGPMTGYPLLLDLTGRKVVVVGGGMVASRRTRGLHEAGADVLVVAPEVLDEIAAVARVERRPFAAADLDGAWLAV